MQEALLDESTFVLDFVGEVYDPTHRAEFSREPDDHTDEPHTLLLRWDHYVDFGQPDRITVTVVPGDTLNEDDEPDEEG